MVRKAKEPFFCWFAFLLNVHAGRQDLDHIRNLINLERALNVEDLKVATLLLGLDTARIYLLIASQPSAGHLQLSLHLFCWLLGLLASEILVFKIQVRLWCVCVVVCV
ncbi:hypothetical protein M758_1G278800 [Ceratodon purpureus]|uniref:Uncharacterized protein n=1 Tax=Ceratodon purpureus TaxID=3225 RepID=A0A8T0JAE5_CERPU|nr:hypothetical protein KC19_1G287400 [Ceratodon purpureus]KAG0631783.1 hypothetical protein M758_1G278800 [Ceratodon purpureus]